MSCKFAAKGWGFDSLSTLPGNGTGVDYWPNEVKGYTNLYGSSSAYSYAFGICANYLHQAFDYF